MIFHEIYSVYYLCVQKILEAAMETQLSNAQLRKLIEQYAFSESALRILPALQEEQWQLMRNGKSILKHVPNRPQSLLEKRWLKSILQDPRIALFDMQMPQMEDVEPLFTSADYRIYDQYSDGDDYASAQYIANFRVLLRAMKRRKPVEIVMKNRHQETIRVRFVPKRFEYSLKDDKIRVIAQGCRFTYFNLGKIIYCEPYRGGKALSGSAEPAVFDTLELKIWDERNALERVMLHFAHFEKQCERLSENTYLLKMRYLRQDETEVLIRILSFGPHVQVLGCERMLGQLKERLKLQKNLKLR